MERTSGLTYADLFDFPDDGLRRELIDGELIVSPSPKPEILEPGETLRTPHLPGFEIELSSLFAR